MHLDGLRLRRFADGYGHTRSLATLPSGVGPDLDTPSASGQGSDLPWPISIVGMRPTENPEMQGRLKYAIYDDMRWSDPAVKSTLWIYKLPIRSARYLMSPASSDGIDHLVADAVAWQFGLGGDEGQLDLSWAQLIAQCSLCLDFGAHGHEIAEGDPTTWRDADGDEHDIVPIDRLAPRFASSVRYPDGIRTDPKTGRIAYIIQDVPGALPVPGEQLMWHTLDREGTDWYGQSLLRPMYGPWRLKRALMIAAGIGWDRFAIGIPAVWYPKGGGTEKKAEAEQIARNFRLHERAWMVFEGKRSSSAGGDDQGWDFSVESGQMSDPTGLIRLYDEQIFTAAMQHFMVLGRTSGGNRALGEALGEPFYLAAQAIAEDIVDEIRRVAIRRFVDRNFGHDVKLPKIQVTGIQSHDLGIFATAIYDLAQAGLSFTDIDTQNDIRERLHVRQLPESVVAAIGAGAGVEKTPPPGSTPPRTGLEPVRKDQPPIPTDSRPESVARLAHAAQEGEGLGY